MGKIYLFLFDVILLPIVICDYYSHNLLLFSKSYY